MTDVVLVALGSNLGPRAALLASARNALSLLHATCLLAASRVEETAAFGTGAQGPYLNQMVALRTSLDPRTLLRELQRIEHSLGRVRRARWTARTIDLDIVRFGGRRVTEHGLTLPHPGLESRGFWQREAVELDALVRRAA
jgi:2-amino-4-hydroxy-6-hydroxymethyldihydropteridine diphosphokinase